MSTDSTKRLILDLPADLVADLDFAATQLYRGERLPRVQVIRIALRQWLEQFTEQRTPVRQPAPEERRVKRYKFDGTPVYEGDE